MAQSHDITLTLGQGSGSLELDVWDRYTIALSMLRAGQAWTFSLWRSADRAAAWDRLCRAVRLFDRVTLAIDGHPQITGKIETFERHADGHGECAMVLSGRDLAGPAQSWDADPTVSLRGVPLEDALSSLFTPLGLTVRVTPAAAAREVQSARRPGARSPGTQRRRRPVDISHPRPGEKVWQLAESIVRRLGFMLWVAPRTDGTVGIVVDVPDYDQQPAYVLSRELDSAGRARGNILAGSEEFSVREVPTDVTVYTGTVRGAAASNRSRAVVQNAGLFDAAVTRGFALDTLQPQPRHIRSERARTLDGARDEAQRAIADGMQGFHRYVARVQGHGQETGGAMRLYAVNSVARVADDLMIDPQGRRLDAPMLITEATMEGSRQGGQTTTLSLVPLGSIVVAAED